MFVNSKVLNYIYENSMIKEGDRVLVALSGGPDSVCLLHLLSTLRETLKFEIFAAHVNHLIRGDEALADEKYVQEICKSLDVEHFIKRVPVEKIAKEKGISTEMAGRDERYAFFDEIKKEKGITKIAIAHNANDQAETLIMRIMRGTGVEGLVGIRPVRNGLYIRPILCLTRDEIENYCGKHELNPRIDKTNLEEIYSRNKVRLKAIPFIKDNFNPDIISTLNRLAQTARVDTDYMDKITNKTYERFCLNKDNELVIEKNLFKEDEAIVTRVIKKSLMVVSKAFNNFEAKHIYDVIKLQIGSTGKVINLTNDVIAINQYGDIVLSLGSSIPSNISDDEVLIKVNNLMIEKELLIFNSYKFKFEIIDNNGKIDFNSDNTKYFNIEDKNIIRLRVRKNGDKMIPFGFSNYKKLKDIFISSKIPKNKRNNIPVIEFDDEIAWIVGVKVSNTFKIARHNKKLLKISFSEGE